MSLLVSAAALALCFIVSESKELTASLVVLPPLVIGYDELYNDSSENGKNATQPDDKTAKKAMLREASDDLDPLVEHPIQQNIEQREFRNAMIDVKGRRGNFRRRYRNVNELYDIH